MAKCFQFSVVTAEGTALEGAAEYCNLPTEGGPVGILANHAPMLCAISEGVAFFRLENGEEKKLKLPGGVAQVGDNRVTVLSDRVEIQA